MCKSWGLLTIRDQDLQGFRKISMTSSLRDFFIPLSLKEEGFSSLLYFEFIVLKHELSTRPRGAILDERLLRDITFGRESDLSADAHGGADAGILRQRLRGL